MSANHQCRCDARRLSVAPTIFDDAGQLDLEGQKRRIDFMIDAGSNGLCILANFSEQFALSDDERSACMHVGARTRRRAACR